MGPAESAAGAADSAGGRAGAPAGRKELFGFRRRVRSTAAAFGEIVNIVAGGGDGEDEDGNISAGGRRGRMRASIVAKTEEMTQMALTAKNEELERLSAHKAELLAGVAEVLQLLSRATKLRAAGHHAADQHLVNTCLQAQAWLRSLLRAHDAGGHDAACRDAPGAGGAWEAEPGGGIAALPAAPDAIGPGGMYPAGGGACAADEAMLTWTSDMGAQDVHSRLYADAD